MACSNQKSNYIQLIITLTPVDITKKDIGIDCGDQRPIKVLYTGQKVVVRSNYHKIRDEY